MAHTGRPVGFRDAPNSCVLMRVMLVRALKLTQAALDKRTSLNDVYQAFGMASECLDEADRLFCEHFHDQIAENRPQKSFEELIAASATPARQRRKKMTQAASA